MPRRPASRIGLAALLGGTTAALLASAGTARAAFHLAVIDEVVTSYGGDSTAQFVEIRMLSAGQSLVGGTRLSAFDASGTHLATTTIVGNVSSSGAGVRWLMATSSFVTASGVAADKVVPAILPASGMVCWGATSDAAAMNPNSGNHVDCVAYGGYTGPIGNGHVGTPTPLDGTGHSLQRTAATANNANDFACTANATPQNNAGASAMLPATTPCSTCGDGNVEPGEGCDDGGIAPGDGCSGACMEESGWDCTGEPSTCAPVCGDGMIVGGEECDDDNTENGDCCSSSCTFEVGPCDDDSPCTTADTCSMGQCVGSEVPPLGTCFLPTAAKKSALKLKNHATDPSKDALNWSWTKGQAFSIDPADDPVSGGADYVVCIYDKSGLGATDKLRMTAIAPAGELCGNNPKPCWKQSSSGNLTYNDPQLTPDGLKTGSIKPNATAGKSSFKFVGKGPNLDVPPLPLAAPVTAQLVNSDGKCWQATFSTPDSVKKPMEDFKAKSD